MRVMGPVTVEALEHWETALVERAPKRLALLLLGTSELTNTLHGRMRCDQKIFLVYYSKREQKKNNDKREFFDSLWLRKNEHKLIFAERKAKFRLSQRSKEKMFRSYRYRVLINTIRNLHLDRDRELSLEKGDMR